MSELSRTDSVDTGSRDLGDGLEFNASGGFELNLRRQPVAELDGFSEEVATHIVE